MTDFKYHVLYYLKSHCLGRQFARKGVFIAHDLQTNWRAVAQAVRDLRIEGVLIGSAKFGKAGYYMPATEQEKKDCIKTYKAELKDMIFVFNRMKRASIYEINKPKQGELFPSMVR